jgi:hypothetical protein
MLILVVGAPFINKFYKPMVDVLPSEFIQSTVWDDQLSETPFKSNYKVPLANANEKKSVSITII